MDGGEVVDEGEESLEDLELSVDSLRNAVVDCLDGGREGDCVQGDESLEGAEDNGDNFGIFRCAAPRRSVCEIRNRLQV